MVQVPLEIRRAIKALQDDTRFDILLTLSERGEMSFSQLETTIGRSSPSLTYHLQALKDGALIENFFKKTEDVDNHSFYRVTEFCERLIDSLFRVIAPGSILVDYKVTYEKETTIKETWTEEVKFKETPSTSHHEHEYEQITSEGSPSE
jgi:DNA-binding transcriptional ArsR family regulator